MIRVHCIVEGKTEKLFCDHILKNKLAEREILLDAFHVNGRGGDLRYERVRKFIEDCLKEDENVYITTFFDLYALHNTFPRYEEAQKINDLYKRVEFLEDVFKKDVCGENHNFKNRFFAHIQPYEFEALLFSDVEKWIEMFPDDLLAKEELLKIRKSFLSPEYINGKRDTSPSHRLENILTKTKYQKLAHGLQACQKIGLEKILFECQHFRSWYNKILALQPLDKE
jgi:hypothetical protein